MNCEQNNTSKKLRHYVDFLFCFNLTLNYDLFKLWVLYSFNTWILFLDQKFLFLFSDHGKRWTIFHVIPGIHGILNKEKPWKLFHGNYSREPGKPWKLFQAISTYHGQFSTLFLKILTLEKAGNLVRILQPHIFHGFP